MKNYVYLYYCVSILKHSDELDIKTTTLPEGTTLLLGKGHGHYSIYSIVLYIVHLTRPSKSI